MSEQSVTLQLPEAVKHGRAFHTLIAEACDAVVMAGSIRRRSSGVGDVDHVAIPRIGTAAAASMFETPVPSNRLWSVCDSLAAAGALHYHAKGERQRTMVIERVRHQIFTATAETWGIVLLTRTGPKVFSRSVAQRLRQVGHVMHDGAVYRLTYAPGDPVLPSLTEAKAAERDLLRGGQMPRGVLVPVPAEHDVFGLMGWPYLDPWNREAA